MNTFLGFIHHLNWIDILLVAMAVRIIYIGAQSGFVSEFFKVLGLILTLFVSFQYFVPVAHIIRQMNLPEGVFLAAGFLLLWGVLALVCKLIRHGLFMFFTIQTISVVDKWGGALLAVARFFMTASMVLFVFLVTENKYLQTKIVDSVSGRYVVSVAPVIYKELSDRIVSRVFPGAEYNTAVRSTMKNIK
jgi:uncharacterized membrane protein required for colicin V production